MIQNEVPLQNYDRVVIGAGIFGLYAALLSARKHYRVLIIEKASGPFTAASQVNQARIHRGYHYPRSLSTALGTAQYVDRFVQEFHFAVNRELKQIYALAKQFSYTDAIEYEKFCRNADIPLTRVNVSDYFNPSTIEAAYETKEYGFDAVRMKAFFAEELGKYSNVTFFYNTSVSSVERDGKEFVCHLNDARGQAGIIRTPYVINATYAGLNEVITRFGYEPFKIKYEYAELALVNVPESLAQVGLTVMDGPFFSLMPFGRTGLHSLSAVSYTPHIVRNEPIDEATMERNSRFIEMRQLAQKFMRPDIQLEYASSMYATKTILKKTELDDARPTLVHVHSDEPYFVSVMSGKLNTIFDLDGIL